MKIKNAIYSFREVQVKKNYLRSRSRSESEIKMTRDQDREVKFQKNSREFSRIEPLAGHCRRGREIKANKLVQSLAWKLKKFIQWLLFTSLTNMMTLRGQPTTLISGS